MTFTFAKLQHNMGNLIYKSTTTITPTVTINNNPNNHKQSIVNTYPIVPEEFPKSIKRHRRGSAFWLKFSLLFPLVLVRILLFLITIISCYFFSLIYIYIFKPNQITFDYIFYPIFQVHLRICLFLCGFYYIKINDKRAHKQIPSIYVSNHCSVVDNLVLIVREPFCALGKKEIFESLTLSIFTKFLNIIPVDRGSAEKRAESFNLLKKEGDKIKVYNGSPNNSGLRKPKSILVFPEGTTSGKDFLFTFATGAFRLEQSVSPVILKYYKHGKLIDFEGDESDPLFFIEMLTGFGCMVVVNFLEEYKASEEELMDAKLYTENVRRYMGESGNLKLSDLSYRDNLVIISSLVVDVSTGNNFSLFFNDYLEFKEMENEHGYLSLSRVLGIVKEYKKLFIESGICAQELYDLCCDNGNDNEDIERQLKLGLRNYIQHKLSNN